MFKGRGAVESPGMEMIIYLVILLLSNETFSESASTISGFGRPENISSVTVIGSRAEAGEYSNGRARAIPGQNRNAFSHTAMCPP
jgi:hypothetical protein